jgi:uncharacterized protein (TIGR00369 family)
MNKSNRNEDLLPSVSDCFVCGQKNIRGLKVTFHDHGDRVTAQFIADETLVGYKPVIHGGIISALLDEIIIWAIYAKTRQFGMTAELTIRFLKPMLISIPYNIEGHVREIKGKLIQAYGEIVSEEGEVVAKAQGKVVPISDEKMKALRREIQQNQ